MNAYIYRAALYCEDCAQSIIDELRAEGIEDDGDSETYPQGPYADGGGESDTPQHCANCGLFLENPLTEDGREYVRDYIEEDKELTARGFRDCPSPTVAEWAAFYREELEGD